MQRPSASRHVTVATFGGALLLVVIAYAPWTVFRIGVDHDALASLSHVRSTGQAWGWPNGYYLNSALVSGISAVLTATGGGAQDLLLAYRLLVLLALLGGSGLAGWLVVRITGSRPAGLAAMLLTAFMPGAVGLAAGAEDNIIASFFHLQYAAVLFTYLDADRTRQTSFRSVALLAASLGIAVISHKQYVVLWLTPLLIALVRRDLAGAMLRTYLLTGIAFLMAYVFLVNSWYEQPGFKTFCRTVAYWFVPSPFYRQYYFFNQFGWDLGRQALEITKGLRALFLPAGPAVLFAVAGWLVLLGHAIRYRARAPSRAPLFFLGLAALHVPHALLFESANPERWDVLSPLLVVAFLTWLWGGPAQATRHVRVVLLGLGLVLAAHGAHYVRVSNELSALNRSPGVRELVGLLNESVSDDGPRVLLVGEDELPRARFMLSAVFFDYSTSLYAVTPTGTMLRSNHIYPNYVAVADQDFERITAGADVLMTRLARKRLHGGQF